MILIVSSSMFKSGNSMAQDIAARTPIPDPPATIKGPAEGILKLNIRDGLKRILLSDLYARHGDYDQALDMVDNTKPVTILEKQIAVAEDPEIIRLLEYQRQKIEGLKRAVPVFVPIPKTAKQRADAEYQNVLYHKKHGKLEKAIQAALEALKLYQQIENIAGQLLVRYQLALLYKETDNNTEALRQAEKFMELEQELELVKKVEEIQELLRELGKETTTD